MKKLVLVFIFISVFSCKTKVPQKKTNTFLLSDSWILNKVSYLEANFHDKTILFNDATNQCFKDSRWQFNTTNNDGTYSINDLYCTIGKREISYRFLKTEEKTGYSDIVLKTKNKAGKWKHYRIKITAFSHNTMQWQYVVYIKNKRHTINLQFEKA
ncbi:hypothetical protein Q4512_06405 [Oceanihabitans sp. 2_MG-2023]|uniref:hypothetical protein n=1 Tax=Oceanihabitans sp. 2_MG-2023 TaxID=3062661 RepID=UPI0026E3A90A|nr:hypothetical protein [Oceanihabitans sp. 2_MG-2023]MDO6596538.1 hypothetical protein [Oceanihabitans sp. 2_MG-2023]